LFVLISQLYHDARSTESQTSVEVNWFNLAMVLTQPKKCKLR